VKRDLANKAFLAVHAAGESSEKIRKNFSFRPGTESTARWLQAGQGPYGDT
jgi:hypothetical protein